MSSIQDHGLQQLPAHQGLSQMQHAPQQPSAGAGIPELHLGSLLHQITAAAVRASKVGLEASGRYEDKHAMQQQPVPLLGAACHAESTQSALHSLQQLYPNTGKAGCRTWCKRNKTGLCQGQESPELHGEYASHQIDRKQQIRRATVPKHIE